MDSFKDALEEFGRAVGKLKYTYAEEFGENPNDLSIHVNSSNDVTIIPENTSGTYLGFFREWVNIDA